MSFVSYVMGRICVCCVCCAALGAVGDGIGSVFCVCVW